MKYVGHKVSKVRWRPQLAGSIDPSDIFASGSWDDVVLQLAASWAVFYYCFLRYVGEPRLHMEVSRYS